MRPRNGRHWLSAAMNAVGRCNFKELKTLKIGSRSPGSTSIVHYRLNCRGAGRWRPFHEPAGRLKTVVRESRLCFAWNVLEDSQHRDRVEWPSVRQIGRKHPRNNGILPDLPGRGNIGVDTMPEEGTIGAGDIEHAHPRPKPAARSVNLPFLKEAVHEFHQRMTFSNRRIRRPRSERKKLTSTTSHPK
jgi:hypothetical protein